MLRFGVRPLLLLGDLVAVLAGVGLLTGVRVSDLVFTALVVVAFSSGGLYRSRLSLSVLDDLPSLVARMLAAAAATSALGVALSTGDQARPLLLAPAVVVLVLVVRTLAYAVVRRTRSPRRTWRTPPWSSVPGGSAGSSPRCCSPTASTGCARSGSSTPTPSSPEDQRPVPVLGGHDCAGAGDRRVRTSATWWSRSARPPSRRWST